MLEIYFYSKVNKERAKIRNEFNNNLKKVEDFEARIESIK